MERKQYSFTTSSNYTKILKGANAKAKANAAQGIPELLKIAKDEADGKFYLHDIMKIKKETSNLFQS